MIFFTLIRLEGPLRKVIAAATGLRMVVPVARDA